VYSLKHWTPCGSVLNNSLPKRPKTAPLNPFHDTIPNNSMESKTLHFANPRLLSQLYHNNEANLTHIEKAFNVSLTTRDDWLTIEGTQDDIARVSELFDILNLARAQGLNINDSDFDHMLIGVVEGRAHEFRETFENPLILKIRNKSLVPKTINQKRYLQFIQKHEIVLSVGPAGTGKTYLAVAAALDALLNKKVEKIILTRPAVEAGEALGFLPGDLQEKILPYLRPLYDAMYDILGPEDTEKMMEKRIIEIAPLAYMRGRTLSNAYVILDEAQNTTSEQMMMFLTRLGDNSRMIVTGDITQIDLPLKNRSGLKQAISVLNNIQGIKIFYFENSDVVRHPLVQKIIEAYEHFFNDRER